jgi:hypothetical protein
MQEWTAVSDKKTLSDSQGIFPGFPARKQTAAWYSSRAAGLQAPEIIKKIVVCEGGIVYPPFLRYRPLH